MNLDTLYEIRSQIRTVQLALTMRMHNSNNPIFHRLVVKELANLENILETKCHEYLVTQYEHVIQAVVSGNIDLMEQYEYTSKLMLKWLDGDITSLEFLEERGDL